LLAGVLLTTSLFQTTINTLIFDTWAIECLIPKLPPKSVIILDNASFHKGKAMQKAMEDAGHILLYLPPYSPDLNPIEKKWAQAKSLRRKLRCSIDDLFLLPTL
jgi:transposase